MKKILFVLISITMSAIITTKAEEVYRDSHVRFTLIDDGTIRMEYAPDGKFVDNKSFIAVVRKYPNVSAVVKDTKKQLTITTSKMTITYKKSEGAFTANNLKIQSQKKASVPFIWTPGTKQKNNLKGTSRTLDGYNGDEYAYSGNGKIKLEDGLLATDGWTLIDDSKGLLFDGSKDWDWVIERKSAEGAQDWYFMAYGHDFKGALKSFTKFAGREPMPPRFTFGYWWSRYWCYSDQELRELIDNFHQYNLPLDVVVIDMDWHPNTEETGGGWTGWDWNTNLFPNYKQFLRYLDEQGVKTTMNLHPADGVRPFEKKYKEFIDRAGIKEGENIEWQGSNKQYVKSIFDTYLHPYMDEGVDFWWLDWQQWGNDKKIPSLSNTFWCNYIFFTDMEKNGTKRPMLYHRWGGLGNHRYQVGFSGDSYISWKSLDYLPYFSSTASNVLYGYWSHDIGGHQILNAAVCDSIEPQLYTRAMQMGEYLPIIRTHSTKNSRLCKEPWVFDQSTQQRLAKVIRGRYTLVPYIYTMAREAYETGVSLCRPLYYDYPDNKEAYDFRNEYMFGDNMLIAPITIPVDSTDGFARIKVWLPKGEWLEYETGTMLTGNKTYERAFNLNEYPVYVKAGSILPYFGALKNLNGTEQAVTIRIFPGADKGEFQLYEDNGEDAKYVEEYATTPLSYVRQGNTLKVTIGQRKGQYKDMPAQRQFKLALPCQIAPKSISMNGKNLEFEYDGYNLETIVDLGNIDCATGVVVNVEMVDNYAVTDGTKARFARLRTSINKYKYRNANMVYTDAFAYLEAAPMRLSYYPESQVETLEKFNGYIDNISVEVIEQTNNADELKVILQSIDAADKLNIKNLQPSDFKTANGQGWDVKYFNNKTLSGDVVAHKQQKTINFSTVGSPVDGLGVDKWSLIAESQYTAPFDGTVLFIISGDDGYRFKIDGKCLCEDWADHGITSRKVKIPVKAGQTYNVCIEYYEDTSNAHLNLSGLSYPDNK